MTNTSGAASVTVPLLVAGPVVRRLTLERCVLWMVVTREPAGRFEVIRSRDQAVLLDTDLAEVAETVRIGTRAWVVLIDARFDEPQSDGEFIEYDWVVTENGHTQRLMQLTPALLYPNQSRPQLRLKKTLGEVLHGSCRKPHYDGDDALAQLDDRLADAFVNADAQRPDVLLMTGDQVYADDVAGPMLCAIHATSELLGLWPERWQGAEINDSETLQSSDFSYYCREALLPKTEENRALYKRFISGARKPIFTSVAAKNHLVGLSEVLAMYCLVWSDRLWPLIDRSSPASMSPDFQEQYDREAGIIAGFVADLPRVQRALAHLPCYMIFDDHDITDDWNLTRGWEAAAYGHPFSRRIIGNALVGYALCQAWGNDPDQLTSLIREQIKPVLEAKAQGYNPEQHERIIDQVLDWEHWHYQVPTHPPLIVLDTRTQRWRSESDPDRPSGLMDWEALTELQQQLIHQPSVLMVSAAPVFGVKLIEAMQRVFTFFGRALTVDAENWMAHPGAAHVMLNIFRHAKTPVHFGILSGDVHYSFVYDIRIRHSKSSPHIQQVTSSGLKNGFPTTLLHRFDRANALLYGRYSPLNAFTKRRGMSIDTRYPNADRNQSLVNGSSLGRVLIDEAGAIVQASIFDAKGNETLFRQPEQGGE
ncbi:MAG: alkaline phosphatase family protein [Saccharospirillum sp.]|uniref:alkaline phosphatase family protein n=1 Tax=Saccharospirillum sp. TaxID=2033801 RepID=UPI0032992357